MLTAIHFLNLGCHRYSIQVRALDKNCKRLTNLIGGDERIQVAAVVTSGDQVFALIEACCGATNLADALIARADWSLDLQMPI